MTAKKQASAPKPTKLRLYKETLKDLADRKGMVKADSLRSARER